MNPPDVFAHCPRCAAPAKSGANPFLCGACGLTYFFNPTVAAAAFVFDASGRCLFIRRAKEPAKGRLAVPGGFIDYDETAEEALRREVREEVGIEITQLAYLGSCTNRYPYRDVVYPVVDLIFTAQAVNANDAVALEDVAGLEWRRVGEIDPQELAFPSLRMGWEILMRRG
jgi:ADP-ribose pyrophosphatase YjhB (NUDIX family)